MLSSRIKVITILALMLMTLMACTHRDDMKINDNQVKQAKKEAPNSLNLEKDSQLDQSGEASTYNLNQGKDNHIDRSIKVSLKSISQEEYDKWVVPMYDSGLDPKGQPLQLPELEKFDYPYVEGMEDKELQNKVNDTIKNAIFNKEFLSDRLYAVGVETTPWSEFEFPGIISNNDILSIPIVLYWDRPHSYYKAISVTIDMKTGERLFLEDIIELNEEFAYKLLNEKDFFIDIDIVGTDMKELLNHYSNGDEELPSEASKNLLDILRTNAEDKKPHVEDFYLTKDGIVLTRFTNNGTPEEINVPLENLIKFLKIKSWKINKSLQLQ